MESTKESNLRSNLSNIHLNKRSYKFSNHYDIMKTIEIYIISNNEINEKEDMMLNNIREILFLFKKHYWNKMQGITGIINSICEGNEQYQKFANEKIHSNQEMLELDFVSENEKIKKMCEMFTYERHKFTNMIEESRNILINDINKLLISLQFGSSETSEIKFFNFRKFLDICWEMNQKCNDEYQKILHFQDSTLYSFNDFKSKII